jgi:hypothetical protein
MTNDDFTAVVEQRCELIKSVLVNKAKEYASDTDRLHNFKVAANLTSGKISPEKALMGMMRKHWVSVLDIVADTEKGKYPTTEMRDEKIGDSINYLILLEALLIESTPKKFLFEHQYPLLKDSLSKTPPPSTCAEIKR